VTDASESYPGFEEFYRADHARLVTFLIKLGFDRELAADAAEEAMLAVLQCWSDVRNPRAYVRAAARHAAIHQVERDRERLPRSIAGGWSTPEHADPFDGVDEAMDALNLMTRLLGRLPEKQRLIFAWHLDGFTNIEIAHYLEMRPATVSSNLRHARNRLRLSLGDPPQFPVALEGGARHDQFPRRDV
jgi:RNA polymerase sigma-70 factor (ECF subfamily)